MVRAVGLETSATVRGRKDESDGSKCWHLECVQTHPKIYGKLSAKYQSGRVYMPASLNSHEPLRWDAQSIIRQPVQKYTKVGKRNQG